MHVCVCTYTSLCVHECACMCVCTYTSLCVHECACMCVCTYTSLCVHECACMCVYIKVFVYVPHGNRRPSRLLLPAQGLLTVAVFL